MTHLSSILGTGKANSTPLGPGSWCWPVVASKTIFIHRVAFPPTWRVTISAVTTFGKTDFSCRGRSSRLRFLTFDSFAFSVEVNHQAKFLHTNGFSRRDGFVSRHRMTGRNNARRSSRWAGQQFIRIELQLSRGNWTWSDDVFAISFCLPSEMFPASSVVTFVLGTFSSGVIS